LTFNQSWRCASRASGACPYSRCFTSQTRVNAAAEHQSPATSVQHSRCYVTVAARLDITILSLFARVCRAARPHKDDKLRLHAEICVVVGNIASSKTEYTEYQRLVCPTSVPSPCSAAFPSVTPCSTRPVDTNRQHATSNEPRLNVELSPSCTSDG
jgi:hypothetical protein